jgi:uncharacterized protein YmfQ (DUF2313 family)
MGRISALALELFPDTCDEMLMDWERVAGLPDACIGQLPSTDLRRSALVRKLTLQRGQSRAYFIALAEYLLDESNVCSIDELYAPARIGGHVGDAIQGQRPAAFARCGINRIGDPLFVPATGWIYAWRLNSPLRSFWLARVGEARIGDPLRLFGSRLLECVITQEKPAHTIVRFGYYIDPADLDPFEVGIDAVGTPLMTYNI